MLDLGNRPIQLLDISAHSNGSLALLDRRNGFLFVGDEAESAQVLMYETYPHPERPPFALDQRLRAHRENMLRLKAWPASGTQFSLPTTALPSPTPIWTTISPLVERIYDGSAVIEVSSTMSMPRPAIRSTACAAYAGIRPPSSWSRTT